MNLSPVRKRLSTTLRIPFSSLPRYFINLALTLSSAVCSFGHLSFNDNFELYSSLNYILFYIIFFHTVFIPSVCHFQRDATPWRGSYESNTLYPYRLYILGLLFFLLFILESIWISMPLLSPSPNTENLGFFCFSRRNLGNKYTFVSEGLLCFLQGYLKEKSETPLLYL